jgi:hypothetical protein
LRPHALDGSIAYEHRAMLNDGEFSQFLPHTRTSRTRQRYQLPAIHHCQRPHS